MAVRAVLAAELAERATERAVELAVKAAELAELAAELAEDFKSFKTEVGQLLATPAMSAALQQTKIKSCPLKVSKFWSADAIATGKLRIDARAAIAWCIRTSCVFNQPSSCSMSSILPKSAKPKRL